MKTLRRALGLLAALALALGLCVAVSAAGRYQSGMFSDVPSGALCEENIAAAVELELMDGVAPGAFAPEGDVTAAMALTLSVRVRCLVRGLALPEDGGEPWYAPYLLYAAEWGILDPGAEVSMDSAVSRREFALWLARAVPDAAEKNSVPAGCIPDVPEGDEAAAEIYYLYRAGVLTGGDSSGSFYPDSPISRREAAVIITRLALPAMRAENALGPETLSPVLAIEALVELAEAEDSLRASDFAFRRAERAPDDVRRVFFQPSLAALREAGERLSAAAAVCRRGAAYGSAEAAPAFAAAAELCESGAGAALVPGAGTGNLDFAAALESVTDLCARALAALPEA